jgi:hypothetical protein
VWQVKTLPIKAIVAGQVGRGGTDSIFITYFCFMLKLHNVSIEPYPLIQKTTNTTNTTNQQLHCLLEKNSNKIYKQEISPLTS